VGTPLMDVPEPNWRSVQRCTDPKKNVRFLRIGPPKVSPNWFSILKGAPSRPPESELQNRGSVSPARLSRLLHEFKALSLWNQNAEPWKSFVPLLVTKFTTDPAARPYSAENWFVISRNS
jgi:hypothetical protein